MEFSTTHILAYKYFKPGTTLTLRVVIFFRTVDDKAHAGEGSRCSIQQRSSASSINTVSHMHVQMNTICSAPSTVVHILNAASSVTSLGHSCVLDHAPSHQRRSASSYFTPTWTAAASSWNAARQVENGKDQEKYDKTHHADQKSR